MSGRKNSSPGSKASKTTKKSSSTVSKKTTKTVPATRNSSTGSKKSRSNASAPANMERRNSPPDNLVLDDVSIENVDSGITQNTPRNTSSPLSVNTSSTASPSSRHSRTTKSTRAGTKRGSATQRTPTATATPVPDEQYNANTEPDDPEYGMTTPVKSSKTRGAKGAVFSPAETEMSSPGSAAPLQPQTLNISHDINHRGRSGFGARSPALLMGMTKPALCIALLLFFIFSGGLAFFFNEWLTIPGLNKQVRALEAQVDKLSGEVDRLEQENDRFESLNDELNTTVQEFQELNDQLNNTANRLEIVNEELNATNLEFKDRIAELTEQNEEYASLNKQLNDTTKELAAEVAIFQAAVADLILENAALSGLSDQLANLTIDLEDLAADQNATLIALQLTLDSIVEENDRLDDLNDDLQTVILFLNDTTVGLGDSLVEISDYIAGQIERSEVLFLGEFEQTFRQSVAQWDCIYQDVFRDYSWGPDRDAEIPVSEFNIPIGWVNTNVLSKICLDVDDFTTFVIDRYGINGLTTNRLDTAVALYTTAGLNFLFPNSEEEGGITFDEWELASYECENLPRRFIYGGATA